jgi:hypothetical protein
MTTLQRGCLIHTGGVLTLVHHGDSTNAFPYIRPTPAPQAYLQYYGIVDLIEVRSVPQSVWLPEIERLHQGEIEAIQLALALQLPLLIEETVGRRVAQQVGLRISGMAGQITAALRRNVISAN